MTIHGPYSKLEAKTYDRDRAVEPLWHIENAYVTALLNRVPASSILDAPVGTGRFLDLYSAPTSEVVGVDLSASMLEEAARRIAVCKASKVTLMKASVTSLPLNDAQFDLVICWRLLHLLPQETLVDVFRELRRVCRGTLSIQCYAQAPLLVRLKARANRWGRRIRLLFKQERALTPWSHIQVYNHSYEAIETAASRAGLMKPSRIEELGKYEGTLVMAVEWDCKK
ncbi:MAG: class I SAM-dependent methyltransferase [Rhodanobacter sp.]